MCLVSSVFEDWTKGYLVSILDARILEFLLEKSKILSGDTIKHYLIGNAKTWEEGSKESPTSTQTTMAAAQGRRRMEARKRMFKAKHKTLVSTLCQPKPDKLHIY